MNTLLERLIGELAWGSSGGVGGFVMIELGDPHLDVREPLAHIRSQRAAVISTLSRRRVFVRGEWHLWIQHAWWHMTTSDRDCDATSSREAIAIALEALNGQRLVSAENSANESITTRLTFDQGAVVTITWKVDPSDNREAWSLSSHTDNRTAAYLLSGRIVEYDS